MRKRRRNISEHIEGANDTQIQWKPIILHKSKKSPPKGTKFLTPKPK